VVSGRSAAAGRRGLLPFGPRALPAIAAVLCALSVTACGGGEGSATDSSSTNQTLIPQPKTIVSLTFDDGLQTQYKALSLLAEHRVPGTFFANSALVATTTGAYRMTWRQLHELADGGNEIGGHTETHPHLSKLSADEQRKEICGDRERLVRNGFSPVSLAYPFGDFDDTSKSLAKQCGYTAARKSGGIKSDEHCANCDLAETVPPLDAFALRAPDSIGTSTTLATLQRYVTQAEDDGGWVILEFHSICDACDDLSISPAKLDKFLDWLVLRTANGTVVKTVGEVMNGSGSEATAGEQP
jgi:peptidoglycan/xylan/chitin deacetylase (PgdA/CDA1 family)